jgi:hypothetical protein
MATTQIDLNGHEFISRLSMVAAEPEDRFGSQSPRSSPPSYVSSEATEPDVGPHPDPVPWDEVQRHHDLWKAHSERSTENWRIAAELGRVIREQKEQEWFKRTGIPIIRNRDEYLLTCSIRTHATSTSLQPSLRGPHSTQYLQKQEHLQGEALALRRLLNADEIVPVL